MTEQQSIEMFELVSLPRVFVALHVLTTNELGDVSKEKRSSGGMRKRRDGSAAFGPSRFDLSIIILLTWQRE